MRRCLQRAVPLVLALAALPAAAIDRIRLESAQLSAAGASMQDVRGTLTLLDGGRTRLELRAARLVLPQALQAQIGEVSALQLSCDNPELREPHFGCPKLAVSARAARLPPLRFDGEATMNSESGSIRVKGQGPQLAGSRLGIAFEKDGEELEMELDVPRTAVAALLPVFAPWLVLPADLMPTGEAAVHARLRQRGGGRSATLTAEVTELSFQNSAATWIGEKLSGRLEAGLDLATQPYAWHIRADSAAGQFLGGPVLLDFARNPLQLTALGRFDGQKLWIDRFESVQRNLARVHGSGELQVAPFSLDAARVELEELQFPDAYTSYAQLLLATTPFNQLTTTGTARGAATFESGKPVALDLFVENFTLADASRELDVQGVASELHWSAGATGPPRPSFLSWSSARGWGFNGAQARVDFATNDRNFQLLQPARLPLFDGALVISRLAGENIGTEQLSGEFEAHIEPISLAPVTRALGLPEFSGVLSGRIPGLTYRNKLLELEGNLEADVFDGRVVASNLSVRDPLGQFPRLHADVVARNLDLELVTSAFEFGTITGRLDVEMLGLETFNWVPTAFDLSLRTPADDRSRHRISQRAVQNLSNLTGGGGGVAAALQGPALRFFETFGYDRIGLSCRLRNDVCEMRGVAPAPNGGYYIIRGSGLPRINIVGISERVDWPRFLAQVEAGLSNTGGIVVN